MSFDLRKGEALLAVVETGSFEQAATRLHLTPSAISQRIRAMEDELGQPLVIRGRPCRATPAGQKILLYLQRSRLLENEWRAEMTSADAGWLSVPVAVNNDTLATWLLPGVASSLLRQRILLDLTLDDQTQTHTLLEEGRAVAGLSSRPDAMRGCVAEPLGIMRYRLLATPDFIHRWFPDGLKREAACQAPLLVFDRKDALQWNLLENRLGMHRDAMPCHFIPASEPFMQAMLMGLGYGMLPELQAAPALSAGKLVELAPDSPVDVPLYWHRWRVQSPRVECLSEAVKDAAAGCLLQNG